MEKRNILKFQVLKRELSHILSEHGGYYIGQYDI